MTNCLVCLGLRGFEDVGLSFQIQTVPGKPGRTGHPTLPFHTCCSCVHLHCQRPAPVYPCWRAALRLLMSPNLVPPPPEPEVTERHRWCTKALTTRGWKRFPSRNGLLDLRVLVATTGSKRVTGSKGKWGQFYFHSLVPITLNSTY